MNRILLVVVFLTLIISFIIIGCTENQKIETIEVSPLPGKFIEDVDGSQTQLQVLDIGIQKVFPVDIRKNTKNEELKKPISDSMRFLVNIEVVNFDATCPHIQFYVTCYDSDGNMVSRNPSQQLGGYGFYIESGVFEQLYLYADYSENADKIEVNASAYKNEPP